MSFIKTALLSSVLAIAGISTAYAQNEAFPHFSSVTKGPDQINEGNLDIHWSIPIFHKAGRDGHDYVVTLSYDSAGIYQPYANGAGVGPDGSFSFQIVPSSLNIFTGTNPTYGFKISYGADRGGGLANTPSPSVCNTSLLNLPPTAAPVTPLNTDAFNWTYTDPSGVQHLFSGAFYKQPGCYSFPTFYSQGPIAISGPVQADDGSGYLLTVLSTSAGIVTTPSGARYQIQANGDPTFNLLTDENGNVSGWTQADLSAAVAGTASAPSDTLGLYPVTVTGTPGQGLPPFISLLNAGTPVGSGPIGTVMPWATFQYVDSNGAAQTVTVNMKAYYIATAFGCQSANNGLNGLLGQADYSSSNQMLVDSIVYPDGSRYSFAYEPTPAGATPVASFPTGAQPVTGRLRSVTLPTGGTITYTYSGPHDGANCNDYNAAQLTRTTSDGEVRTYVRTPTILPNPVSNSSQTVIDDASTHTVVNFQTYTFSSPLTFTSTGKPQPALYLETSRSIADKTQGSVVIQTSTLCYNGAAAPCDGTPITFPILRRTAITQNNFGQQKKTDAFFNAAALATEEDIYDFGQGTPGPLLKKTVTAYAALGNNIQNKPASVTTFDGAGNKTAQTLFQYDETPPVATSGVPNHVAVTGARGNATTTQHWLGGNNYAVTHKAFDDTGNAVTSTDANGNVTTYVYDDNFADGVNRNSRAFLTKTILPSTTDNFTGGAVNHVTSTVYDARTGMMMHLIDQNGNATDHAYDGMMRVTKTILPADAAGNRPETDMSFVNPNTVTLTRPITPPGVLQ